MNLAARLSCLTTLGICIGCGGGETPPPSTPSAQAPPTAASTASPDAAPTTPPASTAPAAAAGPWPFVAAPSEEEKAAQLDRLRKDPGPIKTNWTPPGKSDRYGHAEGLVSAAPDTVKAKLLDFQHFKQLAGPKFKSVKVVDKQGASTDVYFQLPIMKGVVTIWYVTRFAPARPGGGGDVIEGTYAKGNIKGMNIAFTVSPGPDEKSTVMVCDLLLQPLVPAPQSAIDEELRDACGDAINALKKTL